MVKATRWDRYGKAYYLANYAKAAAYRKAYYANNRKRLLGQKKEYGQRKKSQIKRQKRRYVIANREKVGAIRATAYLRTIKSRRAYLSRPEVRKRLIRYNVEYNVRRRQLKKRLWAKWIKTHRQENRLRTQRWQRENLDRVKATGIAWRRNNPHKCRANEAKRKARKVAATVGNQIDVQAIYRYIREAKVILCFWCLERIPKGKRTVDHFKPLAKGGKHSASNLVPACHHCNCSKGAKHPNDFKKLSRPSSPSAPASAA